MCVTAEQGKKKKKESTEPESLRKMGRCSVLKSVDIYYDLNEKVKVLLVDTQFLIYIFSLFKTFTIILLCKVFLWQCYFNKTGC